MDGRTWLQDIEIIKKILNSNKRQETVASHDCQRPVRKQQKLYYVPAGGVV